MPWFPRGPYVTLNDRTVELLNALWTDICQSWMAVIYYGSLVNLIVPWHSDMTSLSGSPVLGAGMEIKHRRVICAVSVTFSRHPYMMHHIPTTHPLSRKPNHIWSACSASANWKQTHLVVIFCRVSFSIYRSYSIILVIFIHSSWLIIILLMGIWSLTLLTCWLQQTI